MSDKKPTLSLDLTQTQTLVMTPQLQQAISLLQLSNLELSELIDKEMEQNPLLEREEIKPAEPQTQANQAPEGSGEVSDFTHIGSHLLHRHGSRVTQGFDDFSEQNDLNVSKEISLRDHLLSQVQMVLLDPTQRVIATQLVDLVDDAGYIREDLNTLATKLGCKIEMIESTLKEIQQFDPPGIFARDLPECLRLQCQDKGILTPEIEKVFLHLDLLAAHKTDQLQKQTGLDTKDIAHVIDLIKTMNPKPAERFRHEATQPIIPDVFMRPKRGGGWVVELNTETLPRVLVNNQYFEEVSAHAADQSSKKYLSEKFQAANWLVKALHQRAVTITRVASEIVRTQEAFFSYGIEYLRPLILKDIAGKLELHESTISRVTTNKYISTPRGLFELKYFFTTAIGSVDGSQSFSAEAIRHKIKQLIDEEAETAILSDEDIVDKLKTTGIDIARRTVAKYRESLDIAPSSVRRRLKKSAKK